MASKPTAAGSEPYCCEITFTLILSPCFFICSILAARKVSAAAITHRSFFFLRKSAILATVVVFPVPFIPTKRIT